MGKADGMEALETSAVSMRPFVLWQKVYHCFVHQTVLGQDPNSVEKKEKYPAFVLTRPSC
jgi:hypothetical protein